MSPIGYRLKPENTVPIIHDLDLTKRLIHAGEIFWTPVIYHVVVGDDAREALDYYVRKHGRDELYRRFLSGVNLTQLPHRRWY